MRTLSRKEVSEKIPALSSQTRSALARMIGFFEGKKREEIVESKSAPSVMELASGIYVARIQDTHVYFFFGSDSEGDYLMILDVTEARKLPVSDSFFAAKDPRTNLSLNPRNNPTINPRSNPTINPRNNPSINPWYNPTINPLYNPAINPRYNPAYGGPFLYSLDLRQEGYLVRANEQVSIIFDLNAQFCGFTVQHDSGVLLVFDKDNEWIGYMVPSGQDPFLRFNKDNEWIGMLV